MADALRVRRPEHLRLLSLTFAHTLTRRSTPVDDPALIERLQVQQTTTLYATSPSLPDVGRARA